MKRAASLLSLSILLTVLCFAAPPRTEASWVNNTLTEFSQAVTKSDAGALNLEGSSIAMIANNAWGLIGHIYGLCIDTCPFMFRSSVMNGMSDTMIAMYTHPPATTYAFVMDAGKSLGFIPRAHAQGIGFSGLSSILPLWKAFRDVAYALLAAVMIIVGFMVMFRKKIDPKTVVTVQSAIPRIVIALILVTFSYAIVGIMIDLMYLSIVFITYLLAGATGSIIDGPDFLKKAFGGGLFSFMWEYGKAGWAVGDIADFFTGGSQIWQTGAVIATGILGFVIGGAKGGLIGLAALPVMLVFVLVVILLFGVIRLIFLLVDAYINIIILLLISPLQLMTEAIPGTNAFSSWFRNLISKLVVFPITAGMLLVAAILTSDQMSNGVWAPPFLSSGGQAHGLAGIIGLGMILSIPTMAAGIQKALKAEPVVPGGVGPIIGPVSSGIGQLWGMVYQASFIGSTIRHKADVRTPLQVARESGEKGLGGVLGGGGGH